MIWRDQHRCLHASRFERGDITAWPASKRQKFHVGLRINTVIAEYFGQMGVRQVAPETDAEHLSLEIGDAANLRRGHEEVAERIHCDADLDDLRSLDLRDVRGSIGPHKKLDAPEQKRRHRTRPAAKID